MCAVLSFTATQAQTTITQWAFENTTTPSTGLGTLTLIGGATQDVYDVGTTGNAYKISNITPAGQSEQAGFEFSVSTNGFSDITFSCDVRGNNQASKWQHYQYSADGGSTWNTLQNDVSLTNTFSNKTYSLPSACNNNPNLKIRIVSKYGPSNNYEQIQGNGPITNGRWLIDNVTFSYTTLGVSKNEISGLKIYPSPAKSILTVSSNSFAEKQVTLYNVLGKIALSTKVNNQPIDVSSLAKGMYVIKITEEGKTTTRKLIIQ